MQNTSVAEQRLQLENIVTEGTTCADVYSRLGTLQRHAGEFEEAARNLRRSLSIGSDKPHVLVELARVHIQNRSPELAALTAHHALQFDPDSGGAHNVLGLTMLEHGDVSGALQRFVRATQSDPEIMEVP